MAQVIAHAFRRLADEESLIILQPTSPLRLLEDIDASVKLFSSSKKEVVSVSPVKAPGGIFSLKRGSYPYMVKQTKDDAGLLALNGAIYIVQRSRVETGALLGEKVIGYVMPQERSIDIDTESDLRMAEIMAKGLGLDEIFNQWERDR
jgi:CMP-N-acetylneuraminic acid synthetase